MARTGSSADSELETIAVISAADTGGGGGACDAGSKETEPLMSMGSSAGRRANAVDSSEGVR